MAMLVEKTGQIRDRTKGFPEISYCVPRYSLKFMRDCLKAHGLIMSVIPQSHRNSLRIKDLRLSVLRWATGAETDIKAVLAFLTQNKEASIATLEELVEKWAMEHPEAARQSKIPLLDFFKEHGIGKISDLAYETAHKLVEWRSGKSYGLNKSSSASTVKKDLDSLKQIAKLASVLGLMPNGDIWDSVKVKSVAGQNRKVVEPLSIEEQKNLLEGLLNAHQGCHDVALLLLLTGVRKGEIGQIKPSSIENGVIRLHGSSIGNIKTTGKTASANRVIPVCPTILRIFERGLVFKTTANALRLALGKRSKGVHIHRLRHTFAVNNLLAGRDLQMVSYQMGHSGTGITADLYGKFKPEHFKAGFEETINARKSHLSWLENSYFEHL